MKKQHRAKPPATPKKKGRPTTYNEIIGDEICEAIAFGGALYKLCGQKEEWPAERTVYQWLECQPDFAQKYARARERQADRCASEALDGALDAVDASLGRLHWDARRWHASKLAPKKYGEKVTQEHTGPNGGPIQLIDPSKLTDDKLAALESSLTILLGESADGGGLAGEGQE